MLVVNIAQGLRMQGLEIWRDTWEELKSKQFGDQVNSALELSYNFLENDEIKSLFLLCAQIGPDNIDMTYLLKYAIGLGLFPSRVAVEGARIRLRRLISDLKASCWLVGDEENGVLHMTDLVYKFAFSIPSTAQPFIIGNKLRERPKNDTLENCMAVSITEGNFTGAVLECPQLEFLILGSSSSSRLYIGHNVFEGMEGLKVLHVYHYDFPPWPSSLQFLKDLRTLCFKYCTLDDISAIGELVRLEVLSIVYCRIQHLPGNVRNLTNLKLLELKNCSNLERIHPNTLSGLTKLEELYMENSFAKWEDSERNSDKERKNANLSELKSLSKLATLHIHISNAKILPEDLPAKQFKNFRILVGEDWDWSGEYTTSKMLKLKLTASILLDRVKDFLMTAEELYLDKLGGATRNVFDEVEFPQLKHLLVQNDPDIQHIISRRRTEIGNVIAFPSLESLSLNNLSNLEKICGDRFSVGSFSVLRRVKVENCNSSRTLFSFSMFSDLQQLQEIDVSGCKVMETIVAESGKNIVATENSNDAVKDEAIQLEKLQTLTLEHMPKLASFCSRVKLPSTRPETNKTLAANADSEEMMSLGNLEVSCALFNGEIEFPNLVNLRLLSINVKKIWPNQHTEISFIRVQNLTSLIVEGCWNLSYIFTYSMAKSLVQLKELKISDCSIMEEIIVTNGSEEETTTKILFGKLESIKLKGLTKFRRFCSSNSMECPLLKVLWIENCPCLRAMVHSSISREANVKSGSRQVRNTPLFDEKVSFPNLEELYILHMHKLGMIWKNENQAGSFSRLKVLKVEHAKELLRIFPSNMWSRLSNLEILVAKHCDLLKEVFDVRGLMQVEAALKVLQIDNLPNLKYVWDNGQRDGLLSFNKLSSVIAARCPSLKSLFPASVAIGLKQLEVLNVDECGVETLVSEGSATSPNFNFHMLMRLSLYRLKELRSFYPGAHTLNCPILEKLEVFSCPKLELFDLENIHLQETHIKSKQGTHPLFPFRQIVPNLKLLTLSHKETKRINQAKLPEDFFHKLEFLSLNCLHDGSSSHFPFDILHLFFNIKKLAVRCSNIEEVFPSGTLGDNKIVKILSQVRHLILNSVTIKRIWSQESQNKQVLLDLECLEVSGCDQLIDLSPSFESFRNLTTLRVNNCDQFVSLLKSTTARSLGHLTTMVVERCKMLVEIVADEGEEGQIEVAFNRLESLKLHRLESLSCFSMSICNMKFPALTEVIVSQCPKMKVFSNSWGNLHTPKLNQVYVNNQRRWAGNLNFTIEQLYFEKVGLDGIQHLKLAEFPELKEAWLGPALPVNVFYNLSSLVVDACAFQSAAVPSKLLPSLNALEELQIRNCDQLEELFDFEWPQADRGARYLANLKEFHLIDLPKLRRVWDELPEGFLSLRSLTLLNINNCSILKNVFTPTTCLGLVQLKKLQVRSCQILEAIIAAGTEEYGMRAHNIGFPQLESIVFEYLPNLTNFFSGIGDVQCPKLKDITIVSCPQLKFLDDLKQASVDVQKALLYRCMEITCLFGTLSSLTVDGCGNLKYMLPSPMVERFAQFKKLEISNCRMLEEIVVSDGLQKEMLLTELKIVRLKNLPKLIRFCRRNLTCPALEELYIQNCPQLKTFVSDSVNDLDANSSSLFDKKVAFANLEKMEISDMDNIQMIWDDELHADSFYKLRALKIVKGGAVKKIFSSSMLGRVVNLEDLVIRNCNSLQVVFDIQLQGQKNATDITVAGCKLGILDLQNLPNLELVWKEDTSGTMSFQNLIAVRICECPTLPYAFPASIAGDLPNLKMLYIESCGMHEIVAMEKEIEITPKFVFPRLKSLTLWTLKNLRSFYPENHVIEFPMLDTLKVFACYNLETFAVKPQDAQEEHGMSQFQPLCSFEEVVPKLKEWRMSSKDSRMIQYGQSQDLFPQLEELTLQFFKDGSAAIPFDILCKFPNIKRLEGACSDFKVVFADELMTEGEKVISSKIQHLTLNNLPDLTYMWHQESRPDQVLQHVETLEVWDCDSLINLIPSPTYLPNLTTLDVWDCWGLINLMTPSTAKKMVHLTQITVRGCNNVTEIVAKEGDGCESCIVFNKLKSLRLYRLQSLTCFSSAVRLIECPILEEVIVMQCPKMKVFSAGEMRSPKLERVHQTEEKDEWLWMKDLNSTIKQLYTDMVGFRGLGLAHLKLSEFPELVELWHGKSIPVNVFSKLNTLEVDYCVPSTSSVPPNLLPFLNDLEEFKVRNCLGFEEIFGKGLQIVDTSLRYLSKLRKMYLLDLPNLKHVFNEVPCKSLDFKSLKVLKIQNCNSLRYIFTASMVLFLVNLEEIEVKRCAMVEYIIKAGTEKKEEIVDEIMLPKLKSITLEALHKLTNLCSAAASVILQWPSLSEITVIDCPFLNCLQPEAGHKYVDQPKVTKLHSLQSLTRLIIDGCGNLKYLFPSSTAESLIHLKRAEVSNCKMLEEVISVQGSEEETSNKLLCDIEFIKLENLPKLTRFCTCELLECPSLKELQIQDCHHLETFVPHSVAAASHEVELTNSALFTEKVAFPQLERMEIINMDNVKMIWGNKVYSDSFSKLQVLKVESLKELQKLFPDDIFTRLQNLKDLVIRNCYSLEEVFDICELIHIKQIERLDSQLRSLDIRNLPNLKSVWNEDPNDVLSFDELSSVYVWQCPNLQSLFPLSIGKGLKQLEDLDLNGCGLTTIVEKGSIEGALNFVFPRLKFLDLWYLENLEYFFEGIHFLECLALRRLSVFRCDRLLVFTQPTRMQKSLFSFSEMIPNLEQLSLTGRDEEMIKEGQFSSQHFQQLKVIELHCFHSESQASPFYLLKLFHQMKQLYVRCSMFKELFPYQGLDEAIQTLELLKVVACVNLTTLAPSSASFQSLRDLEVDNCDGLVTLMGQSTARSLWQLRKMTITHCNRVSEIVSNEGSKESNDEIIFGKLESLELSDLPCLVSFSSVECSFNFPTLTLVILRNCPKIKFFTTGVSTTPNLKMVHDSGDGKGLWNGSLNATVQQLLPN